MGSVNIGDILLWVMAAVLTASFMYLTPLRYMHIIEPQIRDVLPVEAAEQAGTYVIVDVRDASAFEKVHIPGAVNVPLLSLSMERERMPRSGKAILLMGDGDRGAGIAYGYLEHHGFANIARLSGGIEGWLAYELPLTGTEAGSRLVGVFD